MPALLMLALPSPHNHLTAPIALDVVTHHPGNSNTSAPGLLNLTDTAFRAFRAHCDAEEVPGTTHP